MANKKNRPVPPKKKKTEKRVIWVRVMAILLALLLAGSVLGVIFTTTAYKALIRLIPPQKRNRLKICQTVSFIGRKPTALPAAIIFTLFPLTDIFRHSCGFFGSFFSLEAVSHSPRRAMIR